MITVEVQKISFHPPSRSYAIILKEIGGNRKLPVIVGAFEAQSIALALENIKTPRPMTHDLIGLLIQGVDGHLRTMKITELNDGVFYARLEIDVKNRGLRSIDSRPSDALAVALRLGTPILVDEKVMEDAGVTEIEGESWPEASKTTPEQASRDLLQKELEKAIEEENYEIAAQLRDKIRELGSSGT